MSKIRGRLLIVDDDPDVLEMLTMYFSDGRFEVMTADRGADAVTIARHHRPDAVLLDLFMPRGGMDGVEILRALRTIDATIAVVMVTANANETLGRDTLAIGAFDYVSKPFDFDVLDPIVMAALVTGGSGWPPGSALAS